MTRKRKAKDNPRNSSTCTSKKFTPEKNTHDCAICLAPSKYTILLIKEHEIFFDKKFDDVFINLCERCFQSYMKKTKETKVDKTCYTPRNGIRLFDLNVDYDSEDDSIKH